MTRRAVSKLTAKYQTTVPAPVREALGLQKGDALVFEVDDEGLVTLRRAVPLDEGFNRALDATLAEWESAEDEQAYRDL